MNYFDKLNEWVRGIESSFVNFISAVAPWLAPIAPAYMTYQHAVDALHFPLWVAVPVAVVVEILGFSAISTFMSFWFFNRRNKANAKKAPTGWVIFAFSFYLALIVTSNILLDTFHQAEWSLIAVRALYTLQTIPAALIVISRAGHKSLLAEIEKEKTNEANRSRTGGEQEIQKANGSRKYSELSQSEKYFIINSKSSDAAAELGVTERAIQKWRIRVQEEVKQGKL